MTVADENMMTGARGPLYEHASFESQNPQNESNFDGPKSKFTAQKMREATEKIDREQLKLTRQNSKLEE